MKHRKKYVSVIIFLVLLLLMISIAGDKHKAGKVRVALFDTKTTTLVKAKLYSAKAQGILKGKDEIYVSTEKGIVTLEGCTNAPEDIEAAQIIVENIQGVQEIINHIQLIGRCE